MKLFIFQLRVSDSKVEKQKLNLRVSDSKFNLMFYKVELFIQFGHLLDISPKTFMFFKNLDSEL